MKIKRTPSNQETYLSGRRAEKPDMTLLMLLHQGELAMTLPTFLHQGKTATTLLTCCRQRKTATTLLTCRRQGKNAMTCCHQGSIQGGREKHKAQRSPDEVQIPTSRRRGRSSRREDGIPTRTSRRPEGGGAAVMCQMMTYRLLAGRDKQR